MADFWDLYSGKRSVLGESLIVHDPFDQFAWCQEWRFSIAQYLTDRGETVPDFRGTDGNRQDLSYEILIMANPTTEALWYALKIFDRYREWLRIAERDY